MVGSLAWYLCLDCWRIEVGGVWELVVADCFWLSSSSSGEGISCWEGVKTDESVCSLWVGERGGLEDVLAIALIFPKIKLFWVMMTKSKAKNVKAQTTRFSLDHRKSSCLCPLTEVAGIVLDSTCESKKDSSASQWCKFQQI